MCFFCSFFSCYSSPLHSTLLIRDHAYSPRRVLQRYNAPAQVQLSGVLHIFSAFSLCSPFLLFALFPSYLLVSLPVHHLSLYVLPTPHPFRFCLLPPTFTSVLLFWWCVMHSLPRSLLLALRLTHLPSAYASAYFEVVAHNRYPILMRTLMNFWALIRRLTVR